MTENRTCYESECGWTQEQIAKESGVTIKQVSNYCGADRVEEELITSGNKSPDLTIAQAAALGKMILDPEAV